MNEVTAKELKEMMDQGVTFQLIDVREQNEKDFADIGGELIPLNTIPYNTEKIATDKKVIVYCRSGARSANAIRFLEQQGFEDLYNLKGGILAWSDEVDSSIQKY